MVYSSRENRALYAAAAACLALIAFLSYYPSLRHYFWEDDFVWINEGVRLLNEPELLFSFKPNFRPVFRLFVAGCHLVFGGWAAPYHFAMLAVHALNCVLVFVLLGRLFADRRIAFVAAALFGSSLSHVDAVYWMSAFSGPLGLMFALLSLLSWTSYRAGYRRSASYTASILFFVLALLSKEEAMTFPVLLAATDFSFRMGGDMPFGRRLRGYLPFAVIMFSYVAAQYYVQTDAALRSASYRPGMFLLDTHSLYNVLSAFFFMVLPIKGLAMRPPSWVVVVVPLAVVLAGLALYEKRRVVWVVAWVVVAFLPMSAYSWDFMHSVKSSFVSRYLYMPNVGACALIALIVVSVYDRFAAVSGSGRKFITAAACVVLAVVVWGGTVRTRERSMIWDDRSLSVEAEARAIKTLHPDIAAPAGFILDGFRQRPVFSRHMLWLIYGDNTIKTFDSWNALESDKGLVGRYMLRNKGTFLLDVGSGKTASLYVDVYGTKDLP